MHPFSEQKQPMDMCCKNSVLKNCPIVTGKTPVLESLFNKVAGIQAFRCFFVNIGKFFERTSANGCF